MKWKDADFKNGIEKIRAVLIYGPDAGQVDEYCDLAVKKLGMDCDFGLTPKYQILWGVCASLVFMLVPRLNYFHIWDCGG